MNAEGKEVITCKTANSNFFKKFKGVLLNGLSQSREELCAERLVLQGISGDELELDFVGDKDLEVDARVLDGNDIVVVHICDARMVEERGYLRDEEVAFGELLHLLAARDGWHGREGRLDEVVAIGRV